MRTIEYTTQFKRDYKREIKGKHKAVFSNLFIEIIDTLARDKPLAAKHRDRALSNNWPDHLNEAVTLEKRGRKSLPKVRAVKYEN